MIESLRFAFEIVDGVARIYRTVEFWRPMAQVPGLAGLPSWIAPSLALGALLSLVALSGIAIGSLSVLLTALLLAAVILDEIFGVGFEVAR